MAFVVPAPGADLESAELRAFCRSGMASYKAPWAVEVVSELPRTNTGKMVRKDLKSSAREAVSQAMAVQAG
ncbi:hypothetical protein ACFOJ6_18350 [Gordonia humi]|uniref:AMP-binding enzyme n=1 Tax=Gordonia humi TaxID=686429 RepID=UPI0036202C54